MSKPLEGLRVIELGQLLAGPFAGCMLGYFGAEVIKIEPPGGDPIRNWREVKDGTSLWWRSLGRNKKCISLNLRTDAPWTPKTPTPDPSASGLGKYLNKDFLGGMGSAMEGLGSLASGWAALKNLKL